MVTRVVWGWLCGCVLTRDDCVVSYRRGFTVRLGRRNIG